jgi:type III restriction enzyme
MSAERRASIDRLIVNSPFEVPQAHWAYDRESRTFSLDEGRRPAGYIVATPDSKGFDDPGMFVEIPLVNRIRPRVDAWRTAGYPGVTGTTKRLLDHWNDPEAREGRRFFFCQLEAIETLIWLTEGPEADRVGIDVPSDGGSFRRLCAKMATGSGKTIVMAMVVAWQVLNKVAYSQDTRFSKNVFVVAPGLTVRNRLQVLLPSGPDNYYQEFAIVPPGLLDGLRRGTVVVRNWHALSWETEEQIKKRRSVDKRGARSLEAYVRDVLGEIARARNILVLNDEAHHAWRVPPEGLGKGIAKDEVEEATKWVGGLDRIHAARGILTCYDFSATPFVPSGKKSTEEALFSWIVSDFGLNDAIESGLVKTPRVVVRDDGVPDAKTYKSKLYHIYQHVKDDLNRSAEEHEVLPKLVLNGYLLLGKDWLEARRAWAKAGAKTPPVMITVANRTETAARIKYAFDHKKVLIEDLCDPTRTLHIDSKVLDLAEARTNGEEEGMQAPSSDEDAEQPARKLTKQERAELLRRTVDTVGKIGELGELIQNVISVGMLSEGWDAKTVTHIMGLRAFSSQLLCEQVVGRGLRRTSYDINPTSGLLEAEYVNIFGVPFTFLPHEAKDGPPPPPPAPKTRIEPLPDKRAFEIRWPNVLRVNHTFKPTLTLAMERVKPLELDAADIRQISDLAPVVDGKPDITKMSSIDLTEFARKFRTQKIIFETALGVFDQMQPTWAGNKDYLLAQLVRIVERFITSDKIRIAPPLFAADEVKRRLIVTLNMGPIVQHLWEHLRFENAAALVPVFDTAQPVRSTGDMQAWFTSKPCELTTRSHINLCVYDSAWEASESYELDRNPNVEAWVKNDHLGFEIIYTFDGVVRKYRPDFLIRLRSSETLILETKGQDTLKDKAKREFLDEWVRGVNGHGGFGTWRWAVSKHPKDVGMLLNART